MILSSSQNAGLGGPGPREMKRKLPKKMGPVSMKKQAIQGVKQVIVVASGKGGVGKSTTAGEISRMLCVVYRTYQLDAQSGRFSLLF